MTGRRAAAPAVRRLACCQVRELKFMRTRTETNIPHWKEIMRLYRALRHPPALAAAMAIGGFFALVPSSASAQSGSRGSPLAQQIVDSAQAQHPEADEIGILVETPMGCYGIASTDRSDVGEKCEADDIGPLNTGKPSVEKEGSGFDVSVLLHDAAGRTAGVLTVGFEGGHGRTEASVREMVEKIEAEMAPKIPSKAKLLEGWK